LNLLRTNLIAVIVSLLVLTGYGIDVFGACCDHSEVVRTSEHGKAPSDEKPGSPDSCKCVCHQMVTPTISEPLRVANNEPQFRGSILPRSEFPPDAEPSGIDYPPQLS
jgi:hypothetical protein